VSVVRILSVSDKVEPVLYGPFIRDRVGAIDLIIACGDLPYYYLEYIVGLLDAPLHFVHGNHDRPPTRASSQLGAPAGLTWGENLHGRSVCSRGLLVAGLEGCRRYNPDASFQYSESDVRSQVLLLSLRLWANRVRYRRSLDIFVTHAPPRHIHDAEDLPHQGFAAYLAILRRFRPTLMLHGHQHVYRRDEITETDLGPTRIINTYGYRVIELQQRKDQPGWELIRSSA
jgi:Icc-related predicted phosphoesterase